MTITSSSRREYFFIIKYAGMKLTYEALELELTQAKDLLKKHQKRRPGQQAHEQIGRNSKNSTILSSDEKKNTSIDESKKARKKSTFDYQSLVLQRNGKCSSTIENQNALILNNI